MKFLHKTGVALRVVVAISLIATAGCSSPPSRTVEAPKTCVPDYTGDTNASGQAHGYGEMIFDNCDRYSGTYANNRKVEGVYVWANGTRYEGQWQEGRMYGNGIYTWVNGDVYEGQWENSVMHGQGKFADTNGAVFIGEWKNGEKHYGVWNYEDCPYSRGCRYDILRYEGEFMDGFRHGQGTHTKPDGYTYVGDFYYGKKTGIATITYPDGRKFVGSVRAGVPGEGTYTGPWPEGVSEVLDAERREKQRLADEQNRIEKRLAACDSFGFERGTEAHAECAMKLYMNEQNQGASKPPASTQTSSNDQQLAAIARQQAIQEATIKEQKRIQELEASLRMMQFGIDLMNGTSTPRRSSKTHSQTYSINGQIIRCTTTGSITTCL